MGRLGTSNAGPLHATVHPTLSPLLIGDMPIVIVKSKLKSTRRTDFVARAAADRIVGRSI